MANDLNLPQLSAGQATPEVTSNDATKALGDALANKFDCDLTSGNVSVTSSQYRQAILFRAINVGTTGRTVTLPAVDREFALVECDSANTNTIQLIRGATSIKLSPGRVYLVRTDGTANGLVAKDIGGVDVPWDLSIFLPGTMTDAQICLVAYATRAYSLPTSLSGSYLKCETAPTADTTITLKKSGVSIGTGVILAGQTSGTYTVTATNFAVGDKFSVHGQATADLTIANVSMNIKASR